MKKPRIIILMHYMELGGAETSLLGLLQALDPERIDIDLFLHSHRGELLPMIPDYVNILPTVGAYDVIEKPLTVALRRGHLGVSLGRCIARLKHRLHIRNVNLNDRSDASEFQYVAESVASFLPKINPDVEYDLAISFLSPHNYALKKVRARRRIAWIHTDYTKIYVNRQQELPVWDAYDYVASISPDVTRTFTDVFPELAPKIVEIENILSPEFVCQRADDFDAMLEMSGTIKLLSIGRFSYPKNFDNVPYIAKLIRERHGLDVRWYIIGYGDEKPIRDAIAETGTESQVILLGKKSNPYPYIKACDVYVQPSRYEGKSVTVREAQMLGKPVIVSNYPTAPSQVDDGHTGFIVPLENEKCAEAMARILIDRDALTAVVKETSQTDFGNVAEVDKIHTIVCEN